jgi:hypothetical protein
MTEVERSWSVLIAMGSTSLTIRSTGPVTAITTGVLAAVQALADALGERVASSATAEPSDD